MRQRRRFSDEFKAKEPSRKNRLFRSFLSEFQVHPNQISGWKKQVFGNAGTIYERKDTNEHEIGQAERKQDELFK